MDMPSNVVLVAKRGGAFQDGEIILLTQNWSLNHSLIHSLNLLEYQATQEPGEFEVVPDVEDANVQ